jgi:ABC-2 type transport system permease protein
VTPEESGAPPSGSAEAPPAPPDFGLLGAVPRFAAKTAAIAEMELRKLRHDPTELAVRAVQPLLWLLVFGQVIAGVRGFPSGGLRYLDFLAPGILAQSVLFVAIFHGITIISERDLGILQKYLVSPAPRAAIVLGKAVSSAVRSLAMAALIYVLAAILGLSVNWNPLAIASVLGIAMLGATLFSSLSIIIACIVKTRERMMGMGQVVTMPLFFASNAVYPISIMPGWLQVVSQFNPLTYEVDALRALMLAGASSQFGIGLDFAVLLGGTAVLVIVGGWLCPNIVR